MKKSLPPVLFFKQEMAGLFFQGLLRDHGGLHNPKTNALFLAGWCEPPPNQLLICSDHLIEKMVIQNAHDCSSLIQHQPAWEMMALGEWSLQGSSVGGGLVLLGRLPKTLKKTKGKG